MAIAALVLGILWMCGPTSVLAIVFGCIALGQVTRTGQQGRGMAIAGIVLGALGVVLVPVLSIVAVTFLGTSARPEELQQCKLELRTVTTAVAAFEADHGERPTSTDELLDDGILTRRPTYVFVARDGSVVVDPDAPFGCE